MPTDHVLLTADQIQTRVRELAAGIERDAPGPLHLVGVLKGAFIFLADLVRAMRGPLTVDFVAASSYGAGTVSSGDLQLVKDLDASITGRDVVLVEDIVDTGLTLQALQQLLQSRAPRSLRTVTLLDKPSRRRVPVAARLGRLQHPRRLRGRLRSGCGRAVSPPARHPHTAPLRPRGPRRGPAGLPAMLHLRYT